MAEKISQYRADRIRKLKDLREKGVNPYPYKYEINAKSIELKKKYDAISPEEHVDNEYSLAGRIMQIRNMGKACFLNLQDEVGKIQIYIQVDTVGKDNFKLLKKLDIGDIFGVKGNIFKTKTEEVTINVKEFTILTKSIEQLPEKHHGLVDKEIKFRKRYLDLIVNPEVKEVFKKRSLMISTIRKFLDKRNYMEVETPLLQTQYGGANARPFETHINAWDMKMFLSISPELYLKRLIVGGFEKVYTICKNFRNEGVDHSHNPEFTMIEIYEAYKDYKDMMKLIEDCYEFVCLKINGTTNVLKNVRDHETGVIKEVKLNFKAPWKRITMVDSIKEHLDIDVNEMSIEELKKYLIKKKIELKKKDMSWGDCIIEIFDELIEPKIIQPTHIYNRPKESTPLCKELRGDDRFVEQCEPICCGMEIGNMYSELNDPLKQNELLEEQAKLLRAGGDESHPMDEDFINAIDVGLPPTGGIGWGIDRMAIILLNQDSIRDVLLFPTMKNETNEEEKQ
ncbi:lysine--tRNA ligase [Candidatus Woesearchaeota archaeon]|nr:lysine--tRNA ligase [Candidatus Woesearchaeota archaeon]MBT4387180.1 lysine--tRNA ligase [Candidatus Woesearchaeota archaeon]MBT4596063.1 lysine--tRNA ligase [Candidatus Woesearchaeota archaeon]MBT5741471.1 lysine--tRNA ligase [Candidatus Woesearchaeota archaeon]MBT6505562.1 lysine--tRNA ligase [Candidatus Woesearchaeota archaeon]